jgi:hypothetical protein
MNRIALIFILTVIFFNMYYSHSKSNENYKYYITNLESNTFLPVYPKQIKFKRLPNDNIEFTIYNFEKYCNKIFNNLRHYEQLCMIKKEINFIKKNFENNITNIKSIFNIYCNIMSLYELSLYFYDFFNELNDRYTFYYRFMNENNLVFGKHNNKKIPFFQISKHHHAVEWIYKNIKSEIGTILHVDSHADSNSMINDLNFTKKCIKTNDFSNKNLERIYKSILDPGTVIIPMIAPYEKNNGIIWVTPNWVTEPFCKSDNVITTSYNICSNDGKCPSLFDYSDYNKKKINNNTDLSFKMITSNLKNKSKILNEISNNYILNIDLDYFVTFGGEYSSESSDGISHHRLLFDHGYFMKIQDNVEEQKKFKFEIEHIRKRIDKFLELIIDLKNKNIIPELVIICDSTKVNFTNEELGQEFYGYCRPELTNEFTPKYLTFWLHNTILRNLLHIFSK